MKGVFSYLRNGIYIAMHAEKFWGHYAGAEELVQPAATILAEPVFFKVTIKVHFYK